jgi:hypothetical protein
MLLMFGFFDRVVRLYERAESETTAAERGD